jgi:carboxymethylenebutenolidase
VEQGSEIEIPADGKPLPGYLARPAPGHGPGVLVLHEAFGLVDHIRDVCDRFARAGFTALAPDLYRGRSGETIAAAVELASALGPERVGADLEGAVAALLGEDAVEGSRVGAIGFCLGGHLALLAASRSSRVGAVVDFYGFHPALPVDAARIEAAVLGIFAEKDEFVPSERVEELRRALAGAGVGAPRRGGGGVGHGFMNDARPERHDATAAAAGWDRMLAFLRAELG